MAAPMPTLPPEVLAEDQGPQLLAVFIVFLILPIIFVAMRIAARIVMRTKLWWDDYLVLVAEALDIVQFAMLNLALSTGLGRHIEAIPITDLEPYLFYTFLSELIYAVSITLVKCSILCLYLRIFNINPIFRKICYGMLAFVVVWGVTVFFVTVFQCTPVEGAWNKEIPNEQCFDLDHFVIGTNVPNIVADAAIIVLPIPLVWKLQLSPIRKVGLIAVFCIAAITTVISIIRVTFNAHVDVLDPTWNFIKVAVLSTVEISSGVCCACMPVVYPLFRVLTGRSVRPNSSSKNSKDPSTKGYGMGVSGARIGGGGTRGGKLSTLGSSSDEHKLWNGGHHDDAWSESKHPYGPLGDRDATPIERREMEGSSWATAARPQWPLDDRAIPLNDIRVTRDVDVMQS